MHLTRMPGLLVEVHTIVPGFVPDHDDAQAPTFVMRPVRGDLRIEARPVLDSSQSGNEEIC